jgi:hypothetical protein
MSYVIKSLADCGFTKSSLRKLAFDCGDADDELELSRYIKQYALKNDLLGVAKTFVAIADDLQVFGYYTLSASLIDFPESFPNKDKLPSYPIPVALIGKLAVNKSCQGMGIGQALMRDAFSRILDIAQNIAIYAIRIDPSNQIKQGYYIQKFGFIPFDETLSVFLPIETVRDALR